MKQIAKSLVVVGAMLVAGSVSADMDVDFKPFIGVDYLHAWMPAKTTLTNANGSINLKNAFPKSYPGAAIYVGAKFTDCFGIELGADRSFASKKKTTDVLNVGFPVTYSSKVRREGFYADLVGFLPMDCWELFGSLGVGSVKAKITNQLFTANTPANQLLVNANSNLPFSAKRKSVFRMGVGASYMFTDMFGARAKLGWEGTSGMRLKDKNGVSSKIGRAHV